MENKDLKKEIRRLGKRIERLEDIIQKLQKLRKSDVHYCISCTKKIPLYKAKCTDCADACYNSDCGCDKHMCDYVSSDSE